MDHPHTNALINETSPYLLQHAHNPVNWYPWGKEALAKAKKEGKLLIVSIGYSSCHWCHVMEHESFEDSTVAKLMNDRFISIKIDREERPDIDHIYMTAVHMMNQRGGWPLNCIALPDGRPIWGGTYVPKEQWLNVLGQVDTYHRENPEQTTKYAADLAEGIRQNSIFEDAGTPRPLDKINLEKTVATWANQFDREQGGMQGSPKFPMPVNLGFLLHYGHQTGDENVLQFVETTLTKMARGGIYDQAGGGFARYSVDHLWKVPHFEKMLYDNAQLVGLYAEAYQVFGNQAFLRVIDQSISFLEREMINDDGLFYSALDADSEGVEGKFYVWQEDELKNLLGDDFSLFAKYYNVNSIGLWEHGNYILYRTSDPGDFALENEIELQEFLAKTDSWNSVLLQARDQRIRPGLDDKSLTSWNSMMISGLTKAFRATGNASTLNLAIKCGLSIKEKLWEDGNTLYRNYKNGHRSIPGFHIDYALYAAACLDLFETSLDKSWLELAEAMVSVTMEKFYDSESGMFRFNASDTEVLITHHMETQDNVIPSSNSIMAQNLFRMGHFLVDREYLELAQSMVGQMAGRIEQHPNGYAGWGQMLLKMQSPFYEIVVVGPDAEKVTRNLAKDYLPHALIAGSSSESQLPLFKDRFSKGKTYIFVCRENVCQLPVENPNDAKAIYHNR